MWWRYGQTQQALALSEYHNLKRQTADLKYGSDPTVARRLGEIRQWEDQWNGQSVRGEQAEARQTLSRITDGLQDVMRINAGLERSHPRREALGTALQAMQWVEQSQRIMARKLAAEAAYKEISDLLAAGATDQAWTRLDALQQDLAELTRENALAARAADAQRQYVQLDGSVGDRLRGLESHRSIADLAEQGNEAWQAGDWTLAQREYGQARQRLDELLAKEETADERAIRAKASVEALRLVEEERQRLQGEIGRLTAERDQQASRVKDLEGQIAKLNQQWLADREALAGMRDRLTTVTSAREAWKNSLGMSFVLIPAGEFERARDGEVDSSADEQPRHRVQISRDFLVGQHEVTQSQYQEVTGKNPSWFSPQGEGSAQVPGMDTSQFPVENVTWFDCVDLANRLSLREGRQPYYRLSGEQLAGDKITNATVTVAGGDGYRLLTEAEWEYVARAGTATVFPWGDSPAPQLANFEGGIHRFRSPADGKNWQRPVPVGSYGPNPWGLYDTAGNVWEWVWDWYGGMSTSGTPASWRSIRRDRRKATTGCSEAAAGAATGRTAGRRAAAGTGPATATTTQAFASPWVGPGSVFRSRSPALPQPNSYS